MLPTLTCAIDSGYAEPIRIFRPGLTWLCWAGRRKIWSLLLEGTPTAEKRTMIPTRVHHATHFMTPRLTRGKLMRRQRRKITSISPQMPSMTLIFEPFKRLKCSPRPRLEVEPPRLQCWHKKAFLVLLPANLSATSSLRTRFLPLMVPSLTVLFLRQVRATRLTHRMFKPRFVTFATMRVITSTPAGILSAKISTMNPPWGIVCEIA